MVRTGWYPFGYIPAASNIMFESEQSLYNAIIVKSSQHDFEGSPMCDALSVHKYESLNVKESASQVNVRHVIMCRFTSRVCRMKSTTSLTT